MDTAAGGQARGEHVEEKIVLTLLFRVKKVERSFMVAYSEIMKIELREEVTNHYQGNF